MVDETGNRAEPKGWELQRSLEQIRNDQRDGFAGINSRIDRLVSTDAFNAEQRRVDDSLKAIANDITADRQQWMRELAQEKVDREKGDTAQQAQLDKLVITIRWVAAAILLPVGLYVADVIMNRGG